MRRLLFVVAAHGRLELAAVCLRTLRWTCDQLADSDVLASAIVVASDDNLRTARDLGFGTIERDNDSVSRRFNDGIQLACDPAYNARPATHVCTIGSDDWIDPAVLSELPGPGTILTFREISVVREDAGEIAVASLGRLGWGIRVYPADLLARSPIPFRPAAEDLRNGCDSSVYAGVIRGGGAHPRIAYGDRHPRQIIDWKTAGRQIHHYASVTAHARDRQSDPFAGLEDVYPASSIAAMREVYA